MAQMIALWSVVALAWGALSFLAFLKPFFALLWYVPHCILLWLDDRHRAASIKMRRAWTHKTIPHVKVIKHASTTGLQNWRLDCTEGRQLWTYEKGHKQSFFERYQVGLEKPSPVKPQPTPQAALDAGAEFLKKLQDADGHWANDYSGPLFLLPGAVFAMFIVKNSRTEDLFTPERRSEMMRYILNTQNEDGGWGMHTEGHSIMFGSVLNYVALRLLGCRADNADATRAREWIRGNGGAQSIASWGKVWLAVLGLYGWDGVNPVPPEMWLLPDWCPISMGRVWCHSRIVTLPFGYLYGKRYQCANTHVLEELRGELYVQPFNSIAWSKHRSNVFAADVYVPHSGFYELGNVFLLMWERFGTRTTLGKRLRAAAIRESVKHINYDDESTNYICLGPVNKTLNMVITWLEAGCDINDAAVQKHIERLEDYMWMGPEGLRMAGYNGSQLWDTSFAAQALYATGEVVNRADWHDSLRGAHAYIDVAQVREDPPNRLEFYRSPTKGCWNFSTRAQSWQVSDCTAEGLRVVLQLNKTGIVPRESRFEMQRIYDAIDEILALRSTEYGTGGWASYEEIRAPRYMELLNCAEVYKDIMIEYEYTECTSSCVQSLCLFRRDFPDYRRAEVDEAIKAGVRVLKAKQRPDGSWYGSWGVCFTYGAFFAVEGLLQAEEPHDSDVYRRNREFLMSKQNDDGGWGEDFNSCVTEVYVPNPDGSQVVNTAWAVMALIGPGWQGAGPAVRESIDRGVRFIMSRQLASGDWAQERISGVFNGSCAVHNASYKNNMPVWALAKYTECLRRYGELEATPAPTAAVTASSPIARQSSKRRD